MTNLERTPNYNETDEGRGLRDDWDDGVTIVHSPQPHLIGSMIACNGEVKIGRLATKLVGIGLADDAVSREHAVLKKGSTNGTYVLADLGSTNGTYVDGVRVKQQPLEDGSIIRMSGTVMVFGKIGTPLPDLEIVGRSASHCRTVRQIRTIAQSDLSVLILGETGVGKELVAHRIHQCCSRTGAFVAVNCAAIPAQLLESYFFGHKKGAFTGATEDAIGYFRRADGGAIFLDEVGELPIPLQAKLLRTLETGEVTPVGASQSGRVDIRVIAATNANLVERVANGHFRRDLYARLAGYVIELQPLRRRRQDIPMLAQYFIHRYMSTVPQWSATFVERLMLHRWPMNVRELAMVMQRLAAADGQRSKLNSMDLTEAIEGSGVLTCPEFAVDEVTGPPSSLELEELLSEHGGNVAQVAATLGKKRAQVYRWLKRHNLDPASFRNPDV